MMLILRDDVNLIRFSVMEDISGLKLSKIESLLKENFPKAQIEKTDSNAPGIYIEALPVSGAELYQKKQKD